MSGTDPVAVLRTVCDDGARRARGAGLRAELTAIGRQLDRPLQLAVAGAVSVGKSTLINAVLRRPVAPADAGECTRLVTWYVHGTTDRVLVECADGTVRELGLVDGRVPDRLGVAPEQVVRLRVELDDPWLREVTIIDTPGVNTVSAENEKATRQLLFGDAAAEHAQALIYVLRYVQRFDADTLEEFRALSAACGMTAVNTVAVLTQVDRRSDETDPWPTARRLARQATTDLGGVVLDVVPVIGLLAETARGRLLGSPETAALRELAAIDPDELDDLLLDLDEFTGTGLADDEPVFGPVALPVRRVLVARLHRYGILQAVGHLRRHPGVTDPELHRWLAGRSGYGSDVAASSPTATWQVTPDDPELVRTLAEVLDRFARHGDRLKAFAAVRRLARLSGDAPDRLLLAELRDKVDENRPIAAGLGSLRILAACAAVGRGQLQLDPAMTAELMTLARRDEPAAQLGLPVTASPKEIAAAAREASRRWRRVALLAGPSVGGQRVRDVLGVLEDIAAAMPVRPTGSPERRAPTAARPGRPASQAGRPGASAPTAGSSPPDLRRLLDSPVLVERERAAVAALLGRPRPVAAGLDPAGPPAVRLDAGWLDAAGLDAAGLMNLAELAEVTGTPPGSSRSDVAAGAAELAARFRTLLHRPLPPPDRRAVQAACDAFESIVHSLRRAR